MKYLTRENITLAIAIFGAIGTIATWVVNVHNLRRKINIRIVKACKTSNLLVLYISFNNHSHLPISIECIDFKDKGSYYPCNIKQSLLCKNTTRRGNVITDEKEHYSIPFPINLSPLSGTSGHVAFFDLPPEAIETLPTYLTVRVSTNRGKAIEMKLPLESFLDWVKMF